MAEQLGGRFEPVGHDFNGSTITVPTGADQVPGLVDALAARSSKHEQMSRPRKDGSADGIARRCRMSGFSACVFGESVSQNNRHESHSLRITSGLPLPA